MTANVFAQVETTLRAAFSFEARALGQPVSRSELIALIQGVDGVDYVDFDALWRGDKRTDATFLTAALPRSGRRLDTSATMIGAELLMLDPGPDCLEAYHMNAAERLYQLLPAVFRLRDGEEAVEIATRLGIVPRTDGRPDGPLYSPLRGSRA